MFEIWVYDLQQEEWFKVSGEIKTWEEALDFARNRALKDMPRNVSIIEKDNEGDTLSRSLLEELELELGGK